MNAQYFEENTELAGALSRKRIKFDADEAEQRRADQEQKFKQKALEAQAKYYLDPKEVESSAYADFAPEQPPSTNLKLEINELVWRYASQKTTLEQAEKIACDFWSAIMETND